MSRLPEDLLDQALHLASREPKRPKQASLRRAISTAYYALFHELVDRSSRFLLPGPYRRDLRLRLARSFEHRRMREAARELVSAAQHRDRGLAKSRPQLVEVADAFVALQRARHDADYDLAKRFTREHVLAHIARARDAVRAWNEIEGSREAEDFMVALLVPSRRG